MKWCQLFPHASVCELPDLHVALALLHPVGLELFGTTHGVLVPDPIPSSNITALEFLLNVVAAY